MLVFRTKVAHRRSRWKNSSIPSEWRRDAGVTEYGGLLECPDDVFESLMDEGVGAMEEE